MDRSTLFSLGALLIPLAGACGLDASGLSFDHRDAGPEAGTSEDPNSTKDSSAEVPDAGAADGDAAPAFCVTTDVDERFTTGIGARWIAIGETTAAAATQTEAAFVRIVPAKSGPHKTGALWLRAKSALDSADLSFRFRIDHDSILQPGDGFAFAWIDVPQESDLGDVKDGQGLGLPLKAKGFGFAVDLYKNDSPSDPEVPFFAVLDLDPANGEPGSYRWHANSTVAASGFAMGAWHEAELEVRGGSLSLNVDGAKVATDRPLGLSPSFNGYLGFAAASGGVIAAEDGFAIDHVRARVWTNRACTE